MSKIPKIWFKSKDSQKLALLIEHKTRKNFYGTIYCSGVLGLIIGAGLTEIKFFSGILTISLSLVPIILGAYFMIKENKRFDDLILKKQKGGKNK